MKKFVSAIALLLTLCMLLTAMVGCGEAKSDRKEKDDTREEAEDRKPQKDNKPDAKPVEITGTFSDCLMLEKIGVVTTDQFATNAGGLTYKDYDSGKYGIISNDGVIDSGAIYVDVVAEGQYFTVMEKKAADENDIAGINTCALVDGRGNVLVGPYHATYDIYGRYIIAYSVTEKSSDGNLYFYSNATVLEKPNADKVTYASEWCVYDMVTGKKVEGITGEGNFNGFNKGAFLRYNLGDGYVNYHPEGIVPADEYGIFDDGSYKEEGRVGDVYADDGTKLFSYDLTGFIPYSVSGDYYVARQYVDGDYIYVIMDKTGKIVSTEYKCDSLYLVGELVQCDDTLMNFDGEVVFDGVCKTVYQDRMFGNCYIVRGEDTYTMIDDTGAVFVSIVYDDDHLMYTTEFVAYEEQGDKTMYFNHGTQAFDIEGYSTGPWLIKQSGPNNTYKLVDSMTGDVLLDGYENYSYNARNPETYYLYAKYNGGADVFLVTSMKGFESVIEMKEDLLDDLSAAFEAEGLSVTVNRETGEIAMDSSVLFGGDSSELTAEGKAFLDKFIKAYSSVAFSNKYAGFISKTMVEGHTAPVAGSTFASGLQLSEERAANVMSYIFSGETGVDLSNRVDAFEAVGYSNSQPICNEDGSVNMEASRRVSFRFLVNVDG